MSPKQALGRHTLVDHRTDIYSLGASLYELLTLHPVLEGADRHDLIRQIANEDPKPLRRVKRDIPEELETIVLKSLAKNPEERYATAQEMENDLQRFLEDRPVLARRPSLLQHGAKWSSRHQPMIGAAAGLLMLALALSLISSIQIWR